MYSKPVKKPKNLLPAIIAAVAVLGGGYWFFSHSSERAGKEKKTQPVIVAEAAKQVLYDRIELLGSTFANESVDITSTVTETIHEIDFADGQLVHKGDVIAILEQAEEQAQLKGALSQADEHKRELARLEELIRNKAAAKRDYDERLTQLDIAQHQVEEIKARIADRTMIAPFDGVLGIRRVSAGSLVQPGKVITTIDDVHVIKLDFNVPAAYLGDLTVNTPIEARTEIFPDKVFQGQVETIDSRVDPVTRAVLVRAMIPNPDALIKPGMLMRVVLLRNEHQGVVVPEESLLERQEKHFVLTVNSEEEVVHQQEVQIGIRHPGMVEITSGIKEGDLVIARGVSTARPDQKVLIQELWDAHKWLSGLNPLKKEE